MRTRSLPAVPVWTLAVAFFTLAFTLGCGESPPDRALAPTETGFAPPTCEENPNQGRCKDDDEDGGGGKTATVTLSDGWVTVDPDGNKNSQTVKREADNKKKLDLNGDVLVDIRLGELVDGECKTNTDDPAELDLLEKFFSAGPTQAAFRMKVDRKALPTPPAGEPTSFDPFDDDHPQTIKLDLIDLDGDGEGDGDLWFRNAGTEEDNRSINPTDATFGWGVDGEDSFSTTPIPDGGWFTAVLGNGSALTCDNDVGDDPDTARGVEVEVEP